VTLATDHHESILVRNVSAADAAALAALYNHYIAQTVITFEEEAVSAAELCTRIAEVQAASLPWLVAERSGVVVGYAYASKWRARSAYRFAAEVAVYVAPDRGRQGIGSALYAKLLPAIGDAGVHAAMGGIALPNDASVRLHEKFGFKKVAHFDEVGFKLNRWIDVGYWQLIL